MPGIRRPKNTKIKFTMEMTKKGGLISYTSKGPNDIVSEEDVKYFVEEAKKRLDDLANNKMNLFSIAKEETL